MTETEQEKETGSFGDGCGLGICSLLGGAIGFISVVVLADAEIADEIARHGGDDGGANGVMAAFLFGLPVGLISGLVVGLVLIRVLKWLDRRMQRMRQDR